MSRPLVPGKHVAKADSCIAARSGTLKTGSGPGRARRLLCHSEAEQERAFPRARFRPVATHRVAGHRAGRDLMSLNVSAANAVVDPQDAAEHAGLTYVSDETPGIRRQKSGKGFRYVRPAGAKIEDAATLKRLKALAVPPAWRDVWICPKPDGHIQATGRDA